MFLNLLPLAEDDEEARPVNKLFFEQILAKNPSIMLHEEHVMQAVQKIKALCEQYPDVEYLCEEGKTLLAQILG